MAIQVLASGSALPDNVVTNADLEKIVETTDEWITQMTGIKQRHILRESELSIDYVYKAAQRALEKANVSPDEIDLIIVGTSTPDQIMPSTASILQGKLGIKNSISFDLQAACGGFVYAMTTAYYFMQGNPNIRKALLIGFDAISKVTDWKERTTCVLFGDGYGSMVLGRSTDPKQKGITFCDINCDGAGKDFLQVPWGVAQGYERLNDKTRFLIMNGREVFKSSVTYFAQIIKAALEKSQLTIDDIDWIVPHQANIRIIQAVAERLNLPTEKFVITVDKHSNTSAASIPMAFDHAFNEGKIKKGQRIMLAGFGGGFTWGVVIFEF